MILYSKTPINLKFSTFFMFLTPEKQNFQIFLTQSFFFFRCASNAVNIIKIN